MADAGRNSDMFTNRISIGAGDTEFQSITEQCSNIERNDPPIDKSLEEVDVGINDKTFEDIDEWVASLEKILEDVPSYMCNPGHPGRITRIPENLREGDVKGYEPYILSIGPYHHGKVRVQPMEMRKKLALKHVLQYNQNITLKDYLNEILIMEPIARSFYSDVEMGTEKFVQMLLLDSVSIIIMFCGMKKNRERMNKITTSVRSRADNEDGNVEQRQTNEENSNGDGNENLTLAIRADESNDGMSMVENWYWAMFAHDLFLVENQIPFFVLERIYYLIYAGSGPKLIDTMKYEVTNMLTYYTKQDPETFILQSEEVHHLLHLCHILFRPTIQQQSTSCYFLESAQMFRLRGAVELYEAGVRFEERSCASDCSWLDITFDCGKMAIPCLHVDDNTESLLRNLIALEQMKYPTLGLNISAYIVLLLHLITFPKDAELLRRKGIIQHHLSSDKEMMYLVNRLSKGLAFDYVGDNYSLKHVFHELNCYSERRAPRWRAWLKHRHFSNQWTIMLLLAAFLLLLFTIVQTFYAVYSYYSPFFNNHS